MNIIRLNQKKRKEIIAVLFNKNKLQKLNNPFIKYYYIN